MSSIRVKKVREPLAYVPVQQGQVVVVPTDILPSPEHQDSPVNHEFLVEHARELAGTSGTSAHFVPRPQRTAPIPPNTTRRRSQTLGALESGATSDLTKIPSTSSFQRPFRRSSGSWFVDHVANSSIIPSSGRPVLQDIPSQESSTPLAQERSSTAPNTTLEVIIPEEVRAGLAGTLQDRNSSFTSLASVIHPDDIVDHLSVIGTHNIRHFTGDAQFEIDAHISTVSHLSNAANSILMLVCREIFCTV